MGNQSRRKPKARRDGEPRPRPPTTPPRFAVVRDEEHNTVEIVNVEAVTFARFSVVNGDRPRVALTIGDNICGGPAEESIVYYDNTAADMLAHLILCGVDIEGAARALAAARGDVYRDYIKGPPDELPEPVAYGLAQCAQCELACDLDGCPGWIPGGLDDDCGAFVQGKFEEGGEAEAERLRVPPITVEEHAAELAQIREREREPLPPRAIAEVRAGEVDPEVADRDRFTDSAEATRRSCAFGSNCKRFPACGDCSLYALDRLCESANQREYLDETNGGERPIVHVEHVEQVSGETAEHLTARVARCSVYLGLKSAGVMPGDKWCGVGHEMTDPACALCPYLRIYAPPL